jgi:iron complex outermembrane receptor protein
MRKSPVNYGMAPAALTALALILAHPGNAAAEPAPPAARAYTIPAGNLGESLTDFADQADLKLVINTDLTRGLRAPALRSTVTVEQGLGRLLQGSGLGYRMVGRNTAIIEPKAAGHASEPQSAATLPAVNVTGSADREPDPADLYQLPKSTAGSRIPVEIEKIPQSIQVVTQKTIHDQAAFDFGQVFKTVPSANVGQSRFARFPNWTIRGFPVFIQRNGFRRLLQQSVDSSSLSNVESFEVLKGPGSALHGQGGLGGLVNLVTKQPKNHFEGWISGTYGQYDLGMTDFDVTGPLTPDGALTGRLTGQIERSGSFIEHQDLERENLALNLKYDRGGPVRGYLVTEYVARRTLANPGLPAVGTVVGNGVDKIARSTYLGEPNSDRLDDSSPAVQAWLDIDLNPNWTLSPRFQYHGIDGYQNQVFLTTVQPNGFLVNRGGRSGFHEADRTYLAQLELKGKFDTFGVRHQLLAGMEYEDHRWNVGFNNYTSVPPINVFNPSYWSAEPALATTRMRGSGVLQNGSFYLQDLLSITPKLDFLGGMRHTQIGGSTDYWFGKTDLTTDVTMFNVGSTYKLIDGLSLFAGYGTGTDFDSFGALTFDKQQYRPIETDQKEIGVKLNMDNGLTGTLALFEIYRDNSITPDPAHPGFSTQLGQARSRGVEAEFNWQITDAWNLQGGYTFTDARITKSGNSAERGNRLRNVAEHQANLWTRYEFQNGLFRGVGVGAGMNFVGERPGENFQPSYDLPSYTTLDLSASYRWRNIKTEFFAMNVLDKEYFTASDFTVNAVFPGAPRTLFGRVTINF